MVLSQSRGHATVGDEVLFSTSVPPNVLLILDTSNAMNEIVWHEDFDPSVASTCTAFTDSTMYFYNNDTSETHCGNTRTIFDDNKIVVATRYQGSYLNWLFSDAADAAYTQILQGNNGFPSSCVGGGSFAKYKRAKITAAKQAIQDLVCEVNLINSVRFGLMIFRRPGTDDDPNGGFVVHGVDEYTSQQAADLDSALNSVAADTWAPLSEALFQAYTYFMSRTVSDIPLGQDGVTQFPKYTYNNQKAQEGGAFSKSGPPQVPGSPVQYSCQKNFIIVLTTGEPTKDDFTAASKKNTAAGFTSFAQLIGDYHADGETESQTNLICAGCQTTLYLDDIALFMQQNDFRPDLSDSQTIDTYTIGFTTGPAADSLLAKTAAVGNGIFYKSGDADSMSQAIVDAFSSIIEKSQSFTAATVPATRTSAGENLFLSLFVPTAKSGYWEGHLRSFRVTAGGEIHDANGNCALDDPNAPAECFTGLFLPSAVPFWDAADEVPSPASRNLRTSVLQSGVPTETGFDTGLTAADLGVTFPPLAPYPGSTALNAEGLTDEIIQNVRGCGFGTGVTNATLVGTPAACTTRTSLLSDIFHSNPLVISGPASFLAEPAYLQFEQNLATRDRIIYAGANGGFLHGFLAGTWQAGATPPGYDDGTGAEVMGFMPWPARQNIRHLPIDTGGRDYYFVDGSPAAADVWMYTSATTSAKIANGSEWRTLLMGGLRHGGGSYYALDISDPGSGSCSSPAQGSGYPCYLWEFPTEDDAATQAQMGETWGEAIITKIRVQVGGNDNGGQGFERWVAVVTGGYHPSGDPNDTLSYDPTRTEGRSIFIVDVKTGEILASQTFDATASPGTPQREMEYAIPSTPAVFDLDFDGYADVIFVADLGGNLWKWVIQPIGDDRVNDGSGVVTQPNWTFRKFFSVPRTRKNSSSPWHYKSFFFPPAGIKKSGTLWLALGSGERANLKFVGDSTFQGDNNRFYAMTDLDPLERASPPFATIGETDLTDVTNTAACSNVSAFRGYYFVADEGEKFVTNSEAFLHFVFVGSYIPTASADPCEIGGLGFLHGFRIQCGEGFFDDGSGNPERVLTLDAGLPTDPRITIGTEGDSSNRIIINKQDGELLNIQAPTGFQASGVHYWMEVN